MTAVYRPWIDSWVQLSQEDASKEVLGWANCSERAREVASELLLELKHVLLVSANDDGGITLRVLSGTYIFVDEDGTFLWKKKT